MDDKMLDQPVSIHFSISSCRQSYNALTQKSALKLTSTTLGFKKNLIYAKNMSHNYVHS